MSNRRAPATFDELLSAIESITDQIKVLVSAVDDLRCEVEWQARNAVNHQSPAAPVLQSASEPADEWVEPASEETSSSASADKDDDSLLTAAGRLRAYEELLFECRRGLWMDDWVDQEQLDVHIPEGLVFSVTENVWNDVIELRLVHVVGAECHCAETEGEPFVIAWQQGREFLVRELTDEQARRLQELCLEYQAEKAVQPTLPVSNAPIAAQRGLF